MVKKKIQIILTRPVGFEPTTSGFGNPHSTN
jgi:hypothetical protein